MDFNKVRDGRVSSLRHLDVDLSAAHLLSDSTFKQFDIAGDAIYIDADPSGGIATIYIQPVDSSQAEVPLYASPGTIFNVPFTRIRIVNGAQAGKILRVVYGVGVDFQPGSVAQVSITGTVSQPSANYTHSLKAITVAGEVVRAANPMAKALILQNKSPDEIFVTFDNQIPSSTIGYRIDVGGSFIPPSVPLGVIRAATRALINPAGNVLVIEG